MPSPTPARRSRGDGAPVRILLVDDVLPFIELQRSYLKRTTCRIVTARTGAQALKLCRQEPPDLAFLDSEMPEMDGIAACRLLKEDALLRNIPVVLMAPEGRRADCVRAGCDDVLTKPFEAATFLEAVRRFVPLPERGESRIPVSCRVEFRGRTREHVAYTRDLSPHGLFLKSPRPFTIGTRLPLTLHLPQHPGAPAGNRPPPLALEGEVRRVVRDTPGSHLLPGVGVRFVDAPPEAKRLIEEFIVLRRRR